MEPSPIPPVVDAPQRRVVKYSLTRGDIMRWHFYLLCHNRMVIIVSLVVSLFLAWDVWRTPAPGAYSVAVKIVSSVLLVGFVVFFVGTLTILSMALMIMFKKLRGLLGTHELEIRDDGLVERTDFNESIQRWNGFYKIVTTRRYLYIYVTDYQVHIVPRRYFASEQDEWAFREELEKRMKAART